MANPLHSSASDANSDRRNSTRVGFGATVTVADYDPVVSAPDPVFHAVKASDLSQTGISFVTTTWPTKDRLLLEFGDSDSRVVAKIVNLRCEDLDQGMRRFEVSCEFQEWLESDAK